MPGLVHLLSAWAKNARAWPPAGFTLVEIILVVVIVGLIAGLGLPAITRSAGGARLREAARTVIALNKYARHAAVIRQEQLGVAYYTKEGRVELLGLGSAASSSAELAMEQALSGAAGESIPCRGGGNRQPRRHLRPAKPQAARRDRDRGRAGGRSAKGRRFLLGPVRHQRPLRRPRADPARRARPRHPLTVEPLTGDITVKDLP
ncbi:MAG: prepilin-type N-terminal cleavage/methylation domain-containing protein [Kiritimatiellia bacterium]